MHQAFEGTFDGCAVRLDSIEAASPSCVHAGVSCKAPQPQRLRYKVPGGGWVFVQEFLR